MKWTDLEFFTEGGDRVVAARLAEDINQGKQIFPTVTNILRALDTTPFEQVKVVILGQDPYPTAGHANGLAFSVQPELETLPRSLQNIYKELKDDVGVVRENGDLSGWARQGVLLLNTSLTVLEGQAGSHSEIGWKALTTEIIHKLSLNRERVIFVLWGKKAQENAKIIDRKKHLILRAAHPSPLSATRGFFGSKPFSRINEDLRARKQKEIDWSA